MGKVNKRLLFLSIPFLLFGLAFLSFGIRNVLYINQLKKAGKTTNAYIYNVFYNDTETGIEKIIQANYKYSINKEYSIKEAVYKNKDRYKIGDSICVIFLINQPDKAIIYNELDFSNTDNIDCIKDGIILIICPYLLWLFYKPKEDEPNGE
jgi:hypothetical protein